MRGSPAWERSVLGRGPLFKEGGSAVGSCSRPERGPLLATQPPGPGAGRDGSGLSGIGWRFQPGPQTQAPACPSVTEVGSQAPTGCLQHRPPSARCPGADRAVSRTLPWPPPLWPPPSVCKVGPRLVGGGGASPSAPLHRLLSPSCPGAPSCHLSVSTPLPQKAQPGGGPGRSSAQRPGWWGRRGGVGRQPCQPGGHERSPSSRPPTPQDSPGTPVSTETTTGSQAEGLSMGD